MWYKLAHFIIRFRLALMIGLGLVTVFMGFQLKKIETSYDFMETVPSTHPEMVYFNEFKNTFGEDANILVIGLKDSALFRSSNFRKYKYLNEEIQDLKGVNTAISLASIPRLIKDQENRKFKAVPIFKNIPEEQEKFDSLISIAKNQKLYSGQVLDEKSGATLMLVSIDEEVLNSKQRQTLVNDIRMVGDQFSEATNIDLHYAGLPYVRSVMSGKVRDELQLFLFLSVFVTGIILFMFFRDWSGVIFPMIVIGIMIVWSLGTLALFGYKITILTALIPPIIVVIGVPNCIYLLNKYHHEYNKHGSKMLALSRIINKIGVVTLITNFTTAVGFLVLVFTDISILREFGAVAGLNIFATFIVSIILIPSVFTYLPAPNNKQLKHLYFTPLRKVLNGLDLLVHRHKYTVFGITLVVFVLALIGWQRVNAVSYLVDDLPRKSQVRKDLAFFEKNFGGVMPMEIVVNTNKKRGANQLSTLERVNQLDTFLAKQPAISQPLSMVNFVKGAKQAFYNGDPNFYELPNNRDKPFIYSYLKNSYRQEGNDSTTESGVADRLLQSFTDSTGRQLRISMKVADIGSNKMDHLVNNVIQPKIDEIFGESDLEARITGTTLLFIKGNKFLINNLIWSLFIAFCIIAVIMGFLFGNFRMILISLIPNIIPLVITVGVMGFMGIALKPSTALIFSIAFGISVDDSIHFLAKYRQELKANRFFVPVAVSKSIRETGTSMIYTSLVLFAGFIIFAFSNFGGTVNLGLLTSMTLIVAMITNLTILPGLLLAFDKATRYKKELSENGQGQHLLVPWIEYENGYHGEEEDEDIDINKIGHEESDRINKRNYGN